MYCQRSDVHTGHGIVVILIAIGRLLLPPAALAVETTDSVDTNAVPALLPEWRIYDEPAARDDYRWIAEFDKWVKPREGGRAEAQREHHAVNVSGAFDIPSPSQAGRMVRMRVHGGNPKYLRIHVETAAQQYRIEFDPKHDGVLIATGMIGAPDAATGKRSTQRLTDDGGRWYALRDGLLDLRYGGGRFVVARGPMVLMSFALPSAPEKLTLEMEGRLTLFQVLNLPPLDVAPDPYAVPRAGLAAADSMAWKLDPAPDGGQGAPPVRLERHDDGSVELLAQDVRNAAGATAGFKIESPSIVTFKVNAASQGAGIAFPIPDKQNLALYVAAHDKQSVVCRNPADKKDVEDHLHRGYVYEGPFFCRVIYGVDFVRIDLSADGETWANYDLIPLKDGQTVEPLGVGMVLAAGEQDRPRSIRLSHADIRRFTLFDDALRSDAQTSADRGRLQEWGAVEEKRSAAIRILETSIKNGVTAERLLQTLRTLSPFMRLGEPSREPPVPDFAYLLNKLADRVSVNGDMADVSAWLDTWYALAFESVRDHPKSRSDAHPSLIRTFLYSLYHGQDWDRLRHRALQYKFLANARTVDRLASWMIDRAVAQLEEDSPDSASGYYDYLWSHPLRIYPDHETQDVIDEIFFAAESGELARACKLLTGDLNLNALSVLPGQRSIYRPAGMVLKNLLRSNQALQQALVDGFSEMARIRLHRAVQQDGTDELERIAVQFHGTPAGCRALGMLADRFLTTGNFMQAASRYKELIPLVAGQEKNNTIAKRNLALAMIGETPPEPVPGPVSLPGGEFSAEQFEAIIQSAAVRQREGAMGLSEASRAPSPPLKGVSLRRVLDLPFSAGLPIGLTIDGKHLLVQHGTALVAVDLELERVVWSQPVSRPPKDRFVARPLVFENKVIAATLPANRGMLTCHNLADGAVLWEQPLGNNIGPRPLGMDAAVFILSGSTHGQLSLRRIDAATGIPDFERTLVSRPLDRGGVETYRSIIAGDAMVISESGMLISCDEQGQIRWIKRMEFVPPDADGALATPSAEPSLLQVGSRLIVCSPHSPHIVCVDADTGADVWSHSQPEWRSLVGRSDKLLFVRCRSSIEAIGIEDGRTVWRLPVDHERVCFLPGGGNSLLEVRLDGDGKPESGQDQRNNIRRARWLSAVDGSELKSWPLPQERQDVFDVLHLFAVGQKVYAMTANAEPGDAMAPAPRKRKGEADTPGPAPVPVRLCVVETR